MPITTTGLVITNTDSQSQITIFVRRMLQPGHNWDIQPHPMDIDDYLGNYPVPWTPNVTKNGFSIKGFAGIDSLPSCQTKTPQPNRSNLQAATYLNQGASWNGRKWAKEASTDTDLPMDPLLLCRSKYLSKAKSGAARLGCPVCRFNFAIQLSTPLTSKYR